MRRIAVALLVLAATAPVGADSAAPGHLAAFRRAVTIDRDEAAAAAAAEALRALGVERRDPALEARGLARRALVELDFGVWTGPWRTWLRRADALTRDLPVPNRARAEFLMIEGYLEAMYDHCFETGLEKLLEAAAAARGLGDDGLLADAYTLAARVTPFTGQRARAIDYALRARWFAGYAGDPVREAAAVRVQLRLCRAYLGGTTPLVRTAALRLRELERALNFAAPDDDYVLMAPADLDPLLTHRIADLLAGLRDFPRGPLEDLRLLSEDIRTLLLLRIELGACADLDEYLQVGLSIADWVEDPVAARELNLIRATTLACEGRLNEAEPMIAAVLAERRPGDRVVVLQQVFRVLAERAEFAGRPVTALRWLRAAEQLSLPHPVEVAREAEFAAREFFEGEEAARAQHTRLLDRTRDLRQSRWMLVVVSLGSLCVLFGVWVFQASRQRQHLHALVARQTDSLRRTTAAAEEASRAKTDFLAKINHEMRNPLTAILGACELLGESRLTATDRTEVAAALRGSTRHLLGLVDGVLDISRVESRHVPVRPVPIAIRPLLESIRAQTRLQDAGEPVVVEVHVDADLPPTILCDEDMLRQILLNLGSNAVRHTDRGRVTLRARRGDPPDRLLFEVADTGIGIDPRDHERIFGPFETAGERAETGLGLHICRVLAGRLDARLTCTSQLGKGATFTLDLPLALPPAVPSAASAPAETPAGAVLVVDDERINRDIVARMLTSLGCEVAAAGSQAEVRAALQTWRYQIVLLDLRMPGADGFALAAEIRAADVPQPRIYAMTGDATEEVRRRVLAAGFDGFLAKPFRLLDLQELVAGRVPASISAS